MPTLHEVVEIGVAASGSHVWVGPKIELSVECWMCGDVLGACSLQVADDVMPLRIVGFT